MNIAAHAVDGITPHYTDPDYWDKCSLATGGSRDNPARWRVDLGERFMITGVNAPVNILPVRGGRRADPGEFDILKYLESKSPP